MELQSFDNNQFKSSYKKFENKEKENDKSDKSQKENNKQNSTYCSNKKIIFITSIFIYLIFIYLFCKQIYKTKDKSKIYEKNINQKINAKIKENAKENSTDFSFYISSLNFIETILQHLSPSNSYKGPIFPSDGKITKEWLLDLIDFMKDLENKKSYQEKYIDKVYLLQMMLCAKNILIQKQEALIDIYIPKGKKFTVVGDIHGQFYDLLHIFEINGFPGEDNLYLFNGDFVDRGVFGLECITTLIGLKILYPNYVFLARGNHEDPAMNERYGFKNEVIEKYRDYKIFDCFSEFYKFLPLGHILNKQILVIHGGLFSKEGVTIRELKNINRFTDIIGNGLMEELLWSDLKEEKGIVPSTRGAGVFFGPDVTEKFLYENNLKLLIRSHEVRMEGYQIEPGGKVITVFSAPNYCDQSGNKGAIINFRGGEMNPILIQFDASPHPNIPIYQYIFGY